MSFHVGDRVEVTDYNSENPTENAKIRGRQGVVIAIADEQDDFQGFIEVELFGDPVEGISLWLFYDDEIVHA